MRGHVTAAIVVNAHHINIQRADIAVYQHDGDGGALQKCNQLVGFHGGNHNDARITAILRRLQALHFHLGIIAAVAQHHGIALGAEHIADANDDVGKKLGSDIAHDHQHHLGKRTAAQKKIIAVIDARCLHGAADTLQGVGAHLGAVRQRARYGGKGNAGHFGNLLLGYHRCSLRIFKKCIVSMNLQHCDMIIA